MTPPLAERVAAHFAHVRSTKSGPTKWLAALDFWLVVAFVALVRTLRDRGSGIAVPDAISLSRCRDVVRHVGSQRDPFSTRGKFETHVGLLRATATSDVRWRARGRRPVANLEDLVWRGRVRQLDRADRLRRLGGRSIPVARRGLRSARSSRSSRTRRRTSSAGRSPDRPRSTGDDDPPDDPLSPPESGRLGVLRGAS